MKHLYIASDGTEKIVAYTKEEIASASMNKEIDEIELAKAKAITDATATAKAALLARLGITADEAKLLL